MRDFISSLSSDEKENLKKILAESLGEIAEISPRTVADGKKTRILLDGLTETIKEEYERDPEILRRKREPSVGETEENEETAPEGRKKCLYCGRTYVPYRIDQKYCSLNCRVSAFRARKRRERYESMFPEEPEETVKSISSGLKITSGKIDFKNRKIVWR